MQLLVANNCQRLYKVIAVSTTHLMCSTTIVKIIICSLARPNKFSILGFQWKARLQVFLRQHTILNLSCWIHPAYLLHGTINFYKISYLEVCGNKLFMGCKRQILFSLFLSFHRPQLCVFSADSKLHPTRLVCTKWKHECMTNKGRSSHNWHRQVWCLLHRPYYMTCLEVTTALSHWNDQSQRRGKK